MAPTDDAVGPPTRAARLCAVTLVLWRQWYDGFPPEQRAMLDALTHMVVMNDGEPTPIDLRAATEKAITAYREQHGLPGIDASQN